MRSVYRATTAAICAFLTGCAVAQSVSTNGTMLADDLTSRSRVVVDAFENASNRVHELIKVVSPDVSFTNDYERIENFTNDVSFVVTGRWEVVGFTDWNYDVDITMEGYGCSDVYVVSSNATWFCWILLTLDGEDLEWVYSRSSSPVDSLSIEFRYPEDIRLDPIAYVSATRSHVYGNPFDFARLTDIAPTVSNTVTKSYVESLGIESGVSTNDVCNIVTNEVVFGDWHISGGAVITEGASPDGENHYNVPATLSEISCYTNTTDIPIDVSESIYSATGDDVEDWLPVYSAILSVDSGDIGGTVGEIISILVVSSGRSEGIFSGNTVSHLHFENGAGDMLVDVVRESLNALGLARLTDIPPAISNTVTKSYVESLGIESGVDAQTVTNMTALTPVYGGNGKRFSEWTTEPAGYEDSIEWDGVMWCRIGIDLAEMPNAADINTTSLVFDGFEKFTATRTENPVIGYTLGTQTNSVLAATNVILTAETATNIAQSALGDFAPTGAVRYLCWMNEDEAWQNDPIYIKIDTTSESMFLYLPHLMSFLQFPNSFQTTEIAEAKAAEAVASADTSYPRFTTITNLNQSVQYVSITDEVPSSLSIIFPANGGTKDWIVYVTSVTNVSLVLPPATWWMADAAYTNDVTPATPTALWFSQVTDGVFLLGRQELTPVSIEGGN